MASNLHLTANVHLTMAVGVHLFPRQVTQLPPCSSQEAPAPCGVLAGTCNRRGVGLPGRLRPPRPPEPRPDVAPPLPSRWSRGPSRAAYVSFFTESLIFVLEMLWDRKLSFAERWCPACSVCCSPTSPGTRPLRHEMKVLVSPRVSRRLTVETDFTSPALFQRDILKA